MMLTCKKFPKVVNAYLGIYQARGPKIPNATAERVYDL